MPDHATCACSAQGPGVLGPELLRKLEERRLDMDALREMSAGDIGAALRHPAAGERVLLTARRVHACTHSCMHTHTHAASAVPTPVCICAHGFTAPHRTTPYLAGRQAGAEVRMRWPAVRRVTASAQSPKQRTMVSTNYPCHRGCNARHVYRVQYSSSWQAAMPLALHLRAGSMLQRQGLLALTCLCPSARPLQARRSRRVWTRCRGWRWRRPCTPSRAACCAYSSRSPRRSSGGTGAPACMQSAAVHMRP